METTPMKTSKCEAPGCGRVLSFPLKTPAGRLVIFTCHAPACVSWARRGR